MPYFCFSLQLYHLVTINSLPCRVTLLKLELRSIPLCLITFTGSPCHSEYCYCYCSNTWTLGSCEFFLEWVDIRHQLLSTSQVIFWDRVTLHVLKSLKPLSLYHCFLLWTREGIATGCLVPAQNSRKLDWWDRKVNCRKRMCWLCGALDSAVVQKASWGSLCDAEKIALLALPSCCFCFLPSCCIIFLSSYFPFFLF